jgi:hypothetical protein
MRSCQLAIQCGLHFAAAQRQIHLHFMFNPDSPGSFLIKGLTIEGKVFRPSDWADRLCSVMACFNDQADAGPGAALQYSPYVQPLTIEEVKCVSVDAKLQSIEPMAYRFLLGFAKDNQLQLVGTPSSG